MKAIIIHDEYGYFGTVPEEIAADIGDYSEQLWLNSRNRAFNEVLEIIDDVYAMWSDNKIDTVGEVMAELNKKILTLKGGEQE